MAITVLLALLHAPVQLKLSAGNSKLCLLKRLAFLCRCRVASTLSLRLLLHLDIFFNVPILLGAGSLATTLLLLLLADTLTLL